MDWMDLGVQSIQALVPVVTMLLVMATRKVSPKIPRFAVPLIAMALGAALSYVVTLAGGPAQTVLQAALLGAAATWLRELINTVQQHGASS